MNVSHRASTPPLRPLAVGVALLCGLIEFVALWRSRWGQRRR